MLSPELDLRPMDVEDIPIALQIIEAYDEDDAEEAAESYQDLENQFVLTKEQQIIGVTGCRLATGTLQCYWISWTYIHPDVRGNGYGEQMLRELLARMKAGNVRKVFVSTSDYVDEEDGEIYAAAHRLYENCGFVREVVHPDYYARGETQIIYGLELGEIDKNRQVADDASSVFFNGLVEIDETDDVYVINWEVKKQGLFGLSKQPQFTREDLDIGIEKAKEWNARAVFISFPSNMASVLEPLQQAGFFEEGRLKDYYEDGVDEIHFRYNM